VRTSSEAKLQDAPQPRRWVPEARPLRRDGRYVLYWMTAARRWRDNFALEHALATATALDVPVLVLEALRVDYPWSSYRVHRFFLDGMAANHRAFSAAGVLHYPYVEPSPGAGRGLLAALASQAALVVTDHYPGHFLPAMLRAAVAKVDARFEVIDGCGLLPLQAGGRVFTTAASFRRHLQKSLEPHLLAFPAAEPLWQQGRWPEAEVDPGILRRWPPATLAALEADAPWAALPFGEQVAPVPCRGGAAAAEVALRRFLDHDLAHYLSERQSYSPDRSSKLSAYLHAGHLSPHGVCRALWAQCGWHPGRVAARATGSREGWWGAPPEVEAYLDQLVTWRELNYNNAFGEPLRSQTLESLPRWAQATLAAHAGDPRRECYGMEALAKAETEDRVWNVAQRQLVNEGRIHNMLRMLWGKRILEWTHSPQEALRVMVDLNNRFALDGRDPNSYGGILWVLGKFDRPWVPERPIYGTVRYMSSEATRRKAKLGRL